MKTQVTVLTAASLLLLAACSKAPEPGAAEKAGQKVDQTLERAGQPAPAAPDQRKEGPGERTGKVLDQTILRAGERAQEALKKAETATNKRLEEMGQALERAGERLQNKDSDK